MATEMGSVHGLETCVLEGPGSGKDLPSAEESPSAYLPPHGPGEGGARGALCPSCSKMIWGLIQKVLTPTQPPCRGCPLSFCGSESSTLCSSRPFHTRLMSPVPPWPVTENQDEKVDSCTPVY